MQTSFALTMFTTSTQLFPCWREHAADTESWITLDRTQCPQLGISLLKNTHVDLTNYLKWPT